MRLHEEPLDLLQCQIGLLPNTDWLAATPGVPASDPRYRRALFYLLTCEESDVRYWGQGTWTQYGAELARRASNAASSAT